MKQNLSFWLLFILSGTFLFTSCEDPFFTDLSGEYQGTIYYTTSTPSICNTQDSTFTGVELLSYNQDDTYSGQWTNHCNGETIMITPNETYLDSFSCNDLTMKWKFVLTEAKLRYELKTTDAAGYIQQWQGDLFR